MIRKRSLGTVAAAGGFAAAIALLTGLPSMARADEMSDLRANQELLQRRIDQLAQGIPAPGNPYAGDRAAIAGQPSLAGSFPRSFLIPGTDTSIRVGGEAREILDFWFNGGPPNGSPQTTTVGNTGQLNSIPLHFHLGSPGFSATAGAARSRSTDIFQQSPRESKLNVETRTPTAWGEARTLIEFDFAGSSAFDPGGAAVTAVSDSLVPRLRYAYGTLGGWLAGQANSNFADPDGNAETLDFGGNPGEAGLVRVPQVRYTMPLAPWGALGALSMSIETPETDGSTAAGQIASDGSPLSITPANAALAVACTGPTSTTLTCTTSGTGTFFDPFKAPAPDVTLAWYVPQPWGHWDMSGVIRPGLQIKDGLGVDRTFAGWGIHAGFDVKPGWFGWAKDDTLMQATGGIGIGRYLNSGTQISIQTNYPALQTVGAAVLVHPVPAFGGEIGYQHWWMDNLRSDINFGWSHQDLRSNFAGAGTLNKELAAAHANLIWSPVSFVDVGVEYTWAHRVVVNNLKGDENA